MGRVGVRHQARTGVSGCFGFRGCMDRRVDEERMDGWVGGYSYR